MGKHRRTRKCLRLRVPVNAPGKAFFEVGSVRWGAAKPDFRESRCFCYCPLQPTRSPMFHNPVSCSAPAAIFMVDEYKVSASSRQCHALKRPLREGEWYYSVIIESGDDYVRHDYSAEAWRGPPHEAIGWWKKRMPKSDQRKMVLAPPAVLIDLLRQMEQLPNKSKSRYLLALMLMRRRLLRPGQATESSPLESNLSRFEVIADGSTIDIEPCEISKSESDSLRDELNELLYCEAVTEVDEI